MSKNTVKPGLTRKRGKRVVENPQYAAFVGRILRAYARRVAAGDIEALRSMVALRSDVDTAVRTAVDGLRSVGYSWSEVGFRLGISKQAAQMRYGDPAERGAIDRRLTDAGMAVSVALLARVFADHHPGVPAATACPGCGFVYPPQVHDCPTMRVVRPVLYRRRAEDPRAIARLTVHQHDDLHGRKTYRKSRTPARDPLPTVDSPQLAIDLTAPTSGGGD